MPDNETTLPTPVVTTDPAADETAVLPPVRPGGGRAGTRPVSRSDAEDTATLPKPPVPGGAADETTVLPPVSRGPGAADETAVLPPVRDGGAGARADAQSGDPGSRMPRGFFRDERSAAGPEGPVDRTRELPQVDETGAPRRRPRPDWAEETPLDDLPTLADELLGPREDEDDWDEGHGQGRGGRRR